MVEYDEIKPLDIEAERSFEAYSHYSKTLRTWFVAYGIGGPILFVSNKDIAIKIAAAPEKSAIVYLFLAGVIIQILITFLNKWSNWAAYSLSLNPPMRLRKRDKLIIWLSDQCWIDMLIDLLTLVVFVIGTIMALQVLLR